MPVYISFGQSHCHVVDGKTVDKNTLARVADRDQAFELFGGKFATDYPEEKITPLFLQMFPRGIVDFTS